MKRRTFIEFLGRSGIVVSGSSLLGSMGIMGCSYQFKQPMIDNPLKGISPSLADELRMSQGLTYHIIAKWRDEISATDQFGFNNDFTCFLPNDENPNEGLLWVNHEYFDAMFVNGFIEGEKSVEQIEKERYEVGGSLIYIKKENGRWNLVKDHSLNRRLTGDTIIPFDWHEPIMGSNQAVGTFANCSGGITPWGSILTCEENYQDYYGEAFYKNGIRKVEPGYYQWHLAKDRPPEHYGWVVEINPQTGEAKKLVALGRCAHECATPFQAPDGRLVVYTGDDAANECLYKFIGDEKDSLSTGKLYVANLERGEWVSLDINDQKVLKNHFSSQTQILIRLREAAKLVGGTPLDRPEDIDIDPVTGDVFVSLTNNKAAGNYMGSLMRIKEDRLDKTGLKFTWDTYLAGGEETGFACPDNLAFDPAGNLWITSDISGSVIGKDVYESFKNNGLFFVPRSGPDAGRVIQVASAPKDAELTGPWFSPDGRTLFLSVQHPGEQSPNMQELTSHWPEGGDAVPKSSVVAIQGRALDILMNG